MREIKFRGVTHEFSSPRWVYGDLICDCTDEPRIMTDYHDCYDPITWTVDPATVGQYTGLKDSDGREIYEGDIVKATLKEPSFVKRFRLQNELIGKMFFDNAWWMKERETVNLIPPWRLRYYDLTVIGNIHDNPNLLEADDARD